MANRKDLIEIYKQRHQACKKMQDEFWSQFKKLPQTESYIPALLSLSNQAVSWGERAWMYEIIISDLERLTV